MAFLLEISALFLEDCPSQLAQIREAIARNDSEALERVAHTLKGAVGNFGAGLVYAAAQKLEMMGQEDKMDGADEVCADLTREIERLKTALSALANETPLCVA